MAKEVTIEKADNGFIVRCYHEGSGKEPGRSIRHIAKSSDEATRIASGILGSKTGEESDKRSRRSKNRLTKQRGLSRRG